MSWAVGYDSTWNRDIGYGVPAICDHPGCNEKIDRGLSYVCGGEPYGGEHGCGLYFCGHHLFATAINPKYICERCAEMEEPFEPKPDTEEWINHKATDPTWAKWRQEQRFEKFSANIHKDWASDLVVQSICLNILNYWGCSDLLHNYSLEELADVACFKCKQPLTEGRGLQHS